MGRTVRGSPDTPRRPWSRRARPGRPAPTVTACVLSITCPAHRRPRCATWRSGRSGTASPGWRFQLGRLSAHESRWVQGPVPAPGGPRRGHPRARHRSPAGRLAGRGGPALRGARRAGPVHRHPARPAAALEDGDGRFERRADGYRAIAHEAAGVVVSSEHERDLLHRCGIRPARLAVIPLPLDEAPSAAPPPPGPRRAHGPREIGMLGYVYPGKGHGEALRVLHHLPGRRAHGARRTVAGSRAPRRRLHASAAASGRRLGVRLAARRGPGRRGPHGGRPRWPGTGTSRRRGRSARGSRRAGVPVVPVHQSTVEAVERRSWGPPPRRRPQHRGAGLSRRPARTWLAPGTRLGPTAPEVAARYDDLLSAWAGQLA